MSTPRMTSTLALQLADQADALTLDRFGALDLRIETKPDLTPVTDADRVGRGAAARSARRTPARRRGARRRVRRHGDLRGHGSGCSTRSTAPRTSCAGCRCGRRSSRCCEDGVPVVGVVSAPALQRRWWAGAGEGAFTSFGGDSACASRCPGSPNSDSASLSFSGSDDGLGRAAVATFPRPHRRRVAGAGLRRLLVLLPGRRGRRRHRRRARGQAVGPRPARHPGARGRRVVHQPRRRSRSARRQRGSDQRPAPPDRC